MINCWVKDEEGERGKGGGGVRELAGLWLYCPKLGDAEVESETGDKPSFLVSNLIPGEASTDSSLGCEYTLKQRMCLRASHLMQCRNQCSGL